jgi:hypothetical protein
MRGQDQSSSSRFGYNDLERCVAATQRLRLCGEMLGVTPPIARNTDDTGSCGPFGQRRGIA